MLTDLPVASELPEGIEERLEELRELHRQHPTKEMADAAQLMAQMLHIAVYGETWARPMTPEQVWMHLLGEVRAHVVGAKGRRLTDR